MNEKINISKKIMNKNIHGNEVLIYWMGGAGIIIKSKKYLLGVDLYFSDYYYKETGQYKMIIQPALNPKDITLDFLVSTHQHPDHLDLGSIKYLVNENNDTKIIGPGLVIEKAVDNDISAKRLIELNRGEIFEREGLILKAVFADHGERAADAIGIVIKLNNNSIYFTGDTRYRQDLLQLIDLKEKIDLLILPINGKFGNPDSQEAAIITKWVKPKVVVPVHFWMFVEHGGNPASFEAFCAKEAPETEVKILAIGEELIL